MDELKQVLQGEELRMTEENIRILIQEVDINKDEVIDYNEFLEMMKKDIKDYARG